MKNVIYVDFKNKVRINEPEFLTPDNFDEISKRIVEINATLDLCVLSRDRDVIDNLNKELDGLDQVLAQGITKLTRKG
jgi:hypothetical protein